MSAPRIAVVVPALNEIGSIDAVVSSLLADAPSDANLVVVDGGSTDGTRQAVERLAASDDRISVLDNPARIQAAGVNLGARCCPPGTSILVRADAHCVYPKGWLRRVVDALETTDAASVVVPLRTAADRPGFQMAVAAAQNSLLGNGGARHRSAPVSGWVDHGHHAAFRMADFRRMGGYDESFAVNEDAELDVRIAAGGGRIWLEASCIVDYLPRSTPSALARQYYRYGEGRAATCAKHGRLPAGRQMAPFFAFLACTAGVVGSVLHPALLILPAGYATACVLVAASTIPSASLRTRLAAAVAAATMHLSWGAGFSVGLMRVPVRALRSGGRP